MYMIYVCIGIYCLCVLLILVAFMQVNLKASMIVLRHFSLFVARINQNGEISNFNNYVRYLIPISTCAVLQSKRAVLSLFVSTAKCKISR